jgi:hypothetical protein
VSRYVAQRYGVLRPRLHTRLFRHMLSRCSSHDQKLDLTRHHGTNSCGKKGTVKPEKENKVGNAIIVPQTNTTNNTSEVYRDRIDTGEQSQN